MFAVHQKSKTTRLLQQDHDQNENHVCKDKTETNSVCDLVLLLHLPIITQIWVKATDEWTQLLHLRKFMKLSSSKKEH